MQDQLTVLRMHTIAYVARIWTTLADQLASPSTYKYKYKYKKFSYHKVTTPTSKCHARSLDTSRFDRAHMISYYRSIVTMALSCIISHI